MKILCKKTKSFNNFILRKMTWYEVLSEEKLEDGRVCAYFVKVSPNQSCKVVLKNYPYGGRIEYSDFFIH